MTHPPSSPCAHVSGCVASPRCDAPHVALHADPLDAGGRQTGRDTSCSTRVPDTTRALACLFTAPLRLTALFDLLFVCAHLRFSSQPARWASSVLAWDDRCVCFAGAGAHQPQRPFARRRESNGTVRTVPQVDPGIRSCSRSTYHTCRFRAKTRPNSPRLAGEAV